MNNVPVVSDVLLVFSAVCLMDAYHSECRRVVVADVCRDVPLLWMRFRSPFGCFGFTSIPPLSPLLGAGCWRLAGVPGPGLCLVENCGWLAVGSYPGGEILAEMRCLER